MTPMTAKEARETTAELDKDPEATYDDLMRKVAPAARQDVARTRNAWVEMHQHRDEYLSKSAETKAGVRVLYHKHGLAKAQIARLLGVSRKRVIQILDEKPGTPKRRA